MSLRTFFNDAGEWEQIKTASQKKKKKNTANQGTIFQKRLMTLLIYRPSNDKFCSVI